MSIRYLFFSVFLHAIFFSSFFWQFNNQNLQDNFLEVHVVNVGTPHELEETTEKTTPNLAPLNCTLQEDTPQEESQDKLVLKNVKNLPNNPTAKPKVSLKPTADIIEPIAQKITQSPNVAKYNPKQTNREIDQTLDKLLPPEPIKPKIEPPKPIKAKTPENNKNIDRDLDNLIKNIKPSNSKLQTHSSTPNSKKGEEGPPKAGPKGSEGLTDKEISGIMQKLKPCWRSANNNNLQKVSLVVDFTPQGELENYKFLSNAPEHEFSNKQALSALLDKRCMPLNLSKGKYDLWKSMIITFQP